MTERLTAPQSRALAIGLLLLVLGGTIAALLALGTHYRSNQEAIGELQYRLGHFQRMVEQRAALEAELAKLSMTEPISGFYLKGGTQALAAAELQDYATSVIEASGGRLVSIQPIADKDSRRARQVRVQVQMRGDLATLRQMLYSLESGAPSLLINDIRVAKAHTVRQATAANPPAAVLDVYFTLTGFLRGAAS